MTNKSRKPKAKKKAKTKKQKEQERKSLLGFLGMGQARKTAKAMEERHKKIKDI